MRIRILLHALDRTGPPMLALTFGRWIARTHPDHRIEWVSFRGGALLDDALELGRATVLIDPEAAWDHTSPRADDVRVVRQRARSVAPADVMLAVSVAAGQVLPHLPPPSPPLVTWSVERGEDLHWIDGPLELRTRTTTWLAGAPGVQRELSDLLGPDVEIPLCSEFVEDVHIDAEGVERRRAMLDAPAPPGLLVAGAGIATVRKAPDLFIELALGSMRRHGPIDQFVWFGGQDDPMFASMLAEARRLGLDHVRFMGNVVDIAPWLAAPDVFAHPARLDAFPLVALHAALGGTPVVGFSDSGGLSEMFGEHLLGGGYPDVPAMLDALDELRDPDARVRCAAQQRASIVDQHTPDAAAPLLLERLERAAEREGMVQ